MEEVMEKPAAAAGVAAAGAVALVIIATQTPKVLSWITKKIHSYNKLSVERMEELRFHYQNKCLPIEKNTPLFTVSVQQQSAATADKSLPDMMPVYFLYHEKDRPKFHLPMLFVQGYQPVLNERIWHGRMNSKCEILTELQDLVGYICEYQNLRDGDFVHFSLGNKLEEWGHSVATTFSQEKPFYYDPINMFCEEMKQWLYQLSSIPLDETATNHIDVRVSYVNNIYLSKKFNEKHQLVAFKEFVSELKSSLEDMAKVIENIIRRRSAREYFYNLKMEVRTLIRSACEFAFYYNIRTLNVPTGFSLRQICLPLNEQLAPYKEALNCRRGQLVLHLVKRSGIVNIFPEKLFQQNRVPLNSRSLTCNFSNGEKTVYPLVTKECNANNWWEMPKKGRAESSRKMIGIVERLRTKEHVDVFLEMLATIEKMSFFYEICDKMYELSGDMGNLSVFGCAAKYVKQALATFNQAMKKFETTSKYMYHQADKIYADLNKRENSSLTDKTLLKWRDDAFPHISRSNDDLKSSIKKVIGLIGELEAHVNKINHPDYIKEVKDKIENLISLITFFSGASTQPKRLSAARSPDMLFNRRFSTPPGVGSTASLRAIGAKQAHTDMDYVSGMKPLREKFHDEKTPVTLQQVRSLCLAHSNGIIKSMDLDEYLTCYFKLAETNEGETQSQSYFEILLVRAQHHYHNHEYERAKQDVNLVVKETDQGTALKERAIQFLQVIIKSIVRLQRAQAAEISAIKPPGNI